MIKFLTFFISLVKCVMVLILHVLAMSTFFLFLPKHCRQPRPFDLLSDILIFRPQYLSSSVAAEGPRPGYLRCREALSVLAHMHTARSVWALLVDT